MTGKKTVSLISLGCPKNLVDSEAMLAQLADAGYEPVQDGEPADLALVNTCGFIAAARDEAFEEIRFQLRRKASGEIGRVAVCGCLIPALGGSLKERFPDVDLWLGPFDEPRLVESLTLETGTFCHHPAKRLAFFDQNRTLLTVPHTAYLKIADGCDRFCTYCAIPNIRGRFVSKPFEAIEQEAERLADFGVRELVLIAQETTFWGSDLPGTPRLADLLERLRRRNRFDWIRVLYAYPTGWDEALIAQFAEKPTPGETLVLPYIDLPLQHACDRILRGMNRKVNRTETEELLGRLRESIPGLTLRTTFIVGFPGETDEEFAQLEAFVKKWRFERAGVFAFCAEEGTRAASLDLQVPEKTKRKRLSQLVRLTQKQAEAFAQNRIGQTFDVLIDTPFFDEDGEQVPDVWIGRSIAESPDIDPVIYVTGDTKPGEIVRCEAVARQGLDLAAAVSN